MVSPLSASNESFTISLRSDCYTFAEKVLVYQVRILFPYWTWSERADFFNFCLPAYRPNRSSSGLGMAWTRIRRDHNLLINISRRPKIFSVRPHVVKSCQQDIVDLAFRSSRCTITYSPEAILSLSLQARLGLRSPISRRPVTRPWTGTVYSAWTGRVWELTLAWLGVAGRTRCVDLEHLEYSMGICH